MRVGPMRRHVLAILAVLATCGVAWGQSVDSFDPGANGVIYAMAVQPDGKILVGGQFSLLGGGGSGTFARSRIARLNVDGSVDTTFNPSVGGSVVTLAVQADGKILVGGVFTMVSGVTRHNIARLNPDGSLDTAFNPGSSGSIYNGEVDVLLVQPDGRILVGGEFLALGGGTGITPRNRIGRLNANGSVDTTFNPGANDAVIALALQPDGGIVVGGVFTTLGGATRNRLGRLNANGTLDTTFIAGTNGNVVTAIALQADGKILVGGDFTGLGGGTGTTPRNKLGRLNADGSVDAGFDPGATASIGGIVYTFGVQADGKILVGGTFTGLGNGGTLPRRNIGRLHSDGSLDLSFDPGANASVYGVVLQSNGSVLVGGSFTALGGGTGTTPRSRLGRITNTDPAVQSLTLTGGTVVTWMRGGAAPEVSRVTFDSSLDGVTYAPLGNVTRVAGGWQLTGQNLPATRDLYIRARGYYASGYETASSSIVEFIANVFVPPATPGDFDGDHRAEVTVFRPSNGVWYIRNSVTGLDQGLLWGGQGDVPVVGDYDGDRVSDMAVFRPSSGTWYIRSSITGLLTAFVWGGVGDVPVQGDYDGDLATDVAVFRPSNGTWYIRSSNTGLTFALVWGGTGDVPVPGDYDADGRADIAVFRPSNGTWYIRSSRTGLMTTVVWGGAGDVAVPGDYDADGRTDTAVFRASDGKWYIRNSSTGLDEGLLWGGVGDIPTPGDFDGDRKTDMAVFRPSNGTWYIRSSITGAMTIVVWGGAGDVPVLGRP